MVRGSAVVPRGLSAVAGFRSALAWPGRRLQRGAIAVEYALVLLIFLPVVVFVGEVFRIALVDLTLARATHEGALAAGRDPRNCQSAFQVAFTRDAAARWLLDRNDDGTIDFSFSGGVGTADVDVEFLADDGMLDNGVVLQSGVGCGSSGAWLAARTAVSVRAGFGATSFVVRAESWAMNQE